MMTLEQAREEINAADREMAVLFERRMKAVEPIIAYKMANNLPIFDSDREAQVIENNSKLIEEEALAGYYKEFISAVMDISKKYQRTILDQAAK